MTHREIEAWVTAAAKDGRRVCDYMDLEPEQRAYARKFCVDYAQSPLTGFDEKARLVQLQIDMRSMDLSLEWMEAEAARIAESDAATWNGGRPR